MNVIVVLLFSPVDFAGSFHPLLVHLPIGILLLAALFQLLSRKEKYQTLASAVSIILFIGMVSAIASCISGYLLSINGDYDERMIFNHQWSGIALAIISVAAWYLNRNERQNTWITILIVFLIILTGHFGGSITHGSDYLIRAFSSSGSELNEQKRKPIPNVQEALVYQDIIKPILTSKCYKCHGPNKQKGKLRLDIPDFILKGGKGGQVIIAGKTEESELIKRILLAKENDDHMPPLEQPQLTKAETALIHWWVGSGADFNKKVNALVQTEKIKPVLLSLQSEEKSEAEKVSDIPAQTVAQADTKAIKELQARGIALTPVAQNSNYLSANFVALDSITEKDLQLLEPLSKQLIWLKLGDSNLDDRKLGLIAKFSSLTRLSLERTAVSDAGIGLLNSLSKLQYINLVGTRVTAKGLSQLSGLKELRQIFLYHTALSVADFSQLTKIFPKAVVDTGGYKIQFLESDTVELKSAKLR
ncbi:MAG: c-type cytochrome domain-containing protein [Pedobacter sp.]|jgi:uncharacterized membrane protein/mono/diheme cytochrome c family protein